VEKGIPIGSLNLAPGHYVRLAVTDTGKGMSEETRKRAFDPFYTTKGLGEGTGLGLATVHGIVKQSGGDISITSELDEGTTVDVWFPATFEVPAKQDANKNAKEVEVAGGNENILVVEDEPVVSDLVSLLLRREGYNVLLSQNGEEALEQYEKRANEIDLILTDVVMPRMGGPELIKCLRERGYDPIVIFASGYTDNTFSSADQIAARADFIQKPYSPRELLRTVRTALDRKLAAAT
jgi:CheY-like chemotaxis protein